MKITSLLILWMGLEGVLLGQSHDPQSLVKEVIQLSEQTKVKPHEWAGFAQRTIEVGQATEVQSGIIETALAGVKKGEKEKPMAADWAKLREELENLQKKKKEQNKQNDPKDNKENKDQKNKEENKDQPQKKEGSSSQENQSKGEQKEQKDQNNSSGDPQKKNESPDPQKGNEKEEAAKGDPSKESKPPESPSSGKLENKEKKEGKSSGEQENQGPQKEAEGSQKVGGQQRDFEQMKMGKISKEELMQLNQVKQGDSPAKLFQVLEGKKKGPVTENQSKDW